jgi:outer membrane protein TolC
LFSLSGTVSYGLDIWGGERRQVEGQRAGVDAQRYTVAATYVILTSNVIDAIIAQAAYRDEIDVTKATVALLGEQVRIAKAQVVAGTSPYANVLTLQSQMASTEATLAPLEEKIDQAADLLAALTGKTPATWKQPIIALSDLQLPEELPLSVPSRLVRQRPDVLIAEAELHAANASIGVATAAMLPNVTLSAGYGTGNTVLGGLFDPAIDARDESAADYRQTVLGAFQQVADTLRGLGHDADALVAQKEAVDAAERAMGLLQANYQAGIATYLQMLVADIQYLQAKLGYVQVVAQRLQDTVALCVALGGGWWNVPASEG